MAFGIWLWLALAAYLAFLAVIIYVFVIADPETSPIANFFTVKLPLRLWEVLQRYLGKKSLDVISFFVSRSLLIVYCTVVFGSWSCIFAYVYPWVLSPTQTFLPTYHTKIGYAVFLSCILSWIYASRRSPGIITPKTIDRYNHFPFDNLMFVEGKTCPTRKIPRLARSKFDRFKYKENIPRFDHYCGWLDNTIGEENYRFFLLFLLVHVVMCGYGSYALAMLFYGEILQKKLLEATFFNRYTGKELHADKWIIFQYLFSKYTVEAALLLLMFVMSIALGLFLGYHAWMTSNGFTTNESYKWSQVQKWYKRELKRYNNAVKKGLVTVNPSVDCNESSTPNIADGDVTCVSGPNSSTYSDETNKGPVKTFQHPGAPPVNIYNRGIIENWREVVFPISLRSPNAPKSKDI